MSLVTWPGKRMPTRTFACMKYIGEYSWKHHKGLRGAREGRGGITLSCSHNGGLFRSHRKSGGGQPFRNIPDLGKGAGPRSNIAWQLPSAFAGQHERGTWLRAISQQHAWRLEEQESLSVLKGESPPCVTASTTNASFKNVNG